MNLTKICIAVFILGISVCSLTKAIACLNTTGIICSIIVFFSAINLIFRDKKLIFFKTDFSKIVKFFSLSFWRAENNPNKNH